MAPRSSMSLLEKSNEVLIARAFEYDIGFLMTLELDGERLFVFIALCLGTLICVCISRAGRRL